MEKQKHNPFSVPEGYFESFPDRLSERISALEAEKRPVKKLGRIRPVLAIAAILAALALITFPVLRLLSPDDSAEDYLEIALLDGAGFFSSDYELAAYFEASETKLDDDEAYYAQAVEYLASTDVEMDLLFE